MPADFEQQPRWNPGLLNEQDRTAARATMQIPTRTWPEQTHSMGKLQEFKRT